MCLGIPMRVVERDGDDGVAVASSVRKRIRLDLLENVAVGDYVLIHAGYAIERIDEREALETLDLIRRVYEAGTGKGPE